jgi:FKBP-type peptidyl-prolyl cis-trans isomerase FkpA
MKRLIVLVSIVLFASCIKDAKKCTYKPSTLTAPQSERVAVQTYLTSKGITASLHPSGFYYTISNAGAGNKAEPCNTVSIQYTARLTNDSIFDATQGSNVFTDRVGAFMPGLQLGMSLVGKGGSVLLYIPPTLGFGSAPYPNAINPIIPGNSILVYDLTISALQ